MTKQEYINLYQQDLAKYKDKSNYRIDDQNIYNLGIVSYKDTSKIWYQFPIDSCLKIIDIKNEFLDCLHNLKVGYIITFDNFGQNEEAIILKINYRRDKKISSFSVKTQYSTKLIKPLEIIFKGVLGEKLADVFRHFSPRGYHFFSHYDIDYANEIIKAYSKI